MNNQNQRVHIFPIITERFGGYSKAEFLVDAPRSQLHIGSGKYGMSRLASRVLNVTHCF